MKADVAEFRDLQGQGAATLAPCPAAAAWLDRALELWLLKEVGLLQAAESSTSRPREETQPEQLLTSLVYSMQSTRNHYSPQKSHPLTPDFGRHLLMSHDPPETSLPTLTTISQGEDISLLC